jgi:aryl-alcohol dehydrogenase
MEELTIDDPRPDEVLVRFTATGLCRADLGVASGSCRPRRHLGPRHPVR